MATDQDNILLIGLPNSIGVAAKEFPIVSPRANGNIMVKDTQIISLMKI